MLLIEERVIAETQAGSFPSVLYYREDEAPCAAVLISCPHPMLGGTADNPVVKAIAEGICTAGGCGLVWNYRTSSSRRSSFLHDHRINPEEEVDVTTARAVLEWLDEMKLCRGPLAVAGYSYGAAISLLVAEERMSALLVSPPLRALPPGWVPRTRELTLVRGGSDFAISEEEVAQSPFTWQRSVTLAGTDHFMLDALDRVKDEAAQWARGLTARR